LKPSSTRLKHFLLIYSVTEARLLGSPRVFERVVDALGAYEDAERSYRSDPRMQVVLVGARSLAEVRVTHGNYFKNESLPSVIADVLREAVH
jgi:uncharacterized protein involved in exopolysaccharide biosynthesis